MKESKEAFSVVMMPKNVSQMTDELQREGKPLRKTMRALLSSVKYSGIHSLGVTLIQCTLSLRVLSVRTSVSRVLTSY